MYGKMEAGALHFPIHIYCARIVRRSDPDLEHILQRKLKITLSLRIVYQSERLSNRRVRSYQDRMIQSVNCLGPELQALSFNDWERLRYAEVDCLQAGPSKAAHLAVAEGSRSRLRHRARIEPGVSRKARSGGVLTRSFNR
jgi:hypothetical protein